MPAPHLMCVDSLLSATLGSSGSSPSILHRVGSRSERGRWALVLSPTRSLTHSFAHSLVHSFNHPLVHSFIHSPTRSLAHSGTQLRALARCQAPLSMFRRP